MRINTSRFGEIDIADEKIIAFHNGIPGFEHCKHFALITSEETEPFHWLQAMEEPDIAIAVINPFRLFPEYSPQVPESALSDIGKPQDEDIVVLTVAVIPPEVTRMTTNLVSPILINSRVNAGRQVILEGSDFQIRQPIFEAVQTLLNGGADNAGADQKA